MNRGENPHKSIPANCGSFWVAALGNSTSAPTVPANGAFTPTTSTYPISMNGISKLSAEAPSRSAAGVYVVTVDHKLPLMQFATAVVVAAGGSPTTALAAEVTKIDTANRQITVKTFTPAGVATDVGTSDLILIKVDYRNSTV